MPNEKPMLFKSIESTEKITEAMQRWASENGTKFIRYEISESEHIFIPREELLKARIKLTQFRD